MMMRVFKLMLIVISLSSVMMPATAWATRLVSSGFELQSATAGIEFGGSSGTGIAVSTTTKRSGSASMEVTRSGTAGTSDFYYQFGAATGVHQAYVRTYLYIATAPSVETGVVELTNNAALTYCGIDLKANRTLQVYYDITGFTKHAVGSASAALNLNQWYRVELYCDNTGGAGALSGRLDGVVLASQTGITDFGNAGSGDLSRAYVGIDAGEWGNCCGADYRATGDLYFDDIAINDTTGNSQNSWPGEGKIVHLHPNGDGDNHGWLKLGGGAGDANNYNQVSETTPDDATTYLKRTAAGANIIDDYNMENSSVPSIGSSNLISLVQVGGRIGATNATSTDRGGIYRIKSQASGTTTSSATIDWSINGWGLNVDGTEPNYQLTSYAEPQAGGKWTPTLLDSMQIGMKNGTSSTNEIRVSALWALVEYQTGTPIAWWKLDDGSGTAIADSSGNVNVGILGDGTCTSGTGDCPTWVAGGRHGAALSFDGAFDNYVNFGDIDAIDGLQTITVSTWVKMTSGTLTAEEHFVDKALCAAVLDQGTFELGGSFGTLHKASWGVNPAGNSGSSIVESTTNIDDGKWHLVTGTLDSSGNVYLYIDGKQEATNNIGVPPVILSSNTKSVELGGHCNGTSIPFTGQLDDVRIYNRTLSAAEVRRLYISGDAIGFSVD
jgi:hypothetical protein